MTLNKIWWWDTCSGDQGSIEYSFIAITPSSTLTRSSNTFRVRSVVQINRFKNYYYWIRILDIITVNCLYYVYLIENINVYIIIIIIIKSHNQHWYPWPFLATPPCRPLLPAGIQGYIPYRHSAAVCRF